MSEKAASTPKKWTQLFASSNVSSSMDEDQKLMIQVKQGNQKAFARLYDKFKGPIMSYVFQMTRNQTQAEELTQEIFLKVYRVRESYEPTAKFSTWLWTIARHASVDNLRKRSKGEFSEVSMDYRASEDSQSLSDQLEAPLTTAEQELIEKVNQKDLEGCMAALPVPQKDALTLRIVSELSYEEIAETLKITLPAVKTLIHRAKNSLTACMGGKTS